ncbi:MAG: ABC transporter substrate-binding protein, partial [Acidimicrobiales bacterium]
MSAKSFDWARRSASPLELDLIEHYAARKISRRDFVRRGVIIGLGAPAMASVIAACGSDEGDTSAPGTTAGGDSPATSAAPAGGGSKGGDLKVGLQFGDANSGLDPLNMLDGGTYGTVSQSFEYLVGLAADGGIGATALAVDWSPNDDASAWTFKLREGVMWQDGTPFTSADVAATIDRMAVAGAGLAGIVTEGNTETPDDLTVVVNLDSPNGNLPVLVSLFNPQSLITPVDYSDGTTLDGRPSGTGAWILDSFDATTFTSVYLPNPNWWGGAVNLDSVTLQGFESTGTMVAAMSAREVDVVQQFNVIDGNTLLNDDEFNVLRPPSAAHRQLWFNTQLPEEGPFADARVRKAVCLCINRQQIVDVLYEGEAIIANDHPIHPSLPFYDAGAAEQITPDIEQAKALLAEAGYADGLTATLQVGNLQEIPDMAAIIEANC